MAFPTFEFPTFLSIFSLFLGYSGLRLCPESATEAETEALQPPDPRRGFAHPESVEVLRRGQELPLEGHVENTHQGARAEHQQRMERGLILFMTLYFYSGLEDCVNLANHTKLIL